MTSIIRRAAWTSRLGLGLVLAGLLLGLAACGGQTREIESSGASTRSGSPVFRDQPKDTIFGDEGLTFGGRSRNKESGGGGLGVNSFLWRASLDTITFMPVNSADPFGGVIITDWHSPAETPGERFKMNIYILGRALRADGIRVTVFRQARDSGGNWADQPVEAGVATKIENAILLKARQLRNESTTSQ